MSVICVRVTMAIVKDVIERCVFVFNKVFKSFRVEVSWVFFMSLFVVEIVVDISMAMMGWGFMSEEVVNEWLCMRIVNDRTVWFIIQN